MHIVFVTTELGNIKNPFGGLATFTNNMASLFLEHGHKVTILLAATKEEEIEGIDNKIDVQQVFVPLNRWKVNDKIAKLLCWFNKKNQNELRICLNMFYKARKVKRKIEEINERSHIDIVHYCNLSAPALFAKETIPYVIRMSSFGVCRREYDKPRLQDVFPKINIIDRERINIRTYKKARYIISPSDLTYEAMKKYIDVCPDIIESPFFGVTKNWDESIYNEKLRNCKYILHFGKLCQLKGSHVVAQTVYHILERYPDMYIVLAGQNGMIYTLEHPEGVLAYEEIARLAGEYSNRIIYLGKLIREQLYPVIQNAELVYLPYRFDNLSNAAIESCALERITIGTKDAGFEQIIEDGVSGFLCEKDNPESYIQAIQEALSLDENAKNNMKQEMKKQMKKFESETVYKKYLEYYQKVIQEWHEEIRC